MPTKALSCKKEDICENGPKAPSCPVGQGSFKMDCFKVEKCSMVRRVQIWHSCWKSTDAVSSGLKRRDLPVCYQRQFKSQHLWWYGLHKCIRYGKLACFGRHYECWKVYQSLQDSQDFFFWFLRPKMTDFAVAFLKICGDTCGISYCFAVKIYHGQHSSNIVITFSDFENHRRAPD